MRTTSIIASLFVLPVVIVAADYKISAGPDNLPPSGFNSQMLHGVTSDPMSTEPRTTKHIDDLWANIKEAFKFLKTQHILNWNERPQPRGMKRLTKHHSFIRFGKRSGPTTSTTPTQQTTAPNRDFQESYDELFHRANQQFMNTLRDIVTKINDEGVSASKSDIINKPTEVIDNKQRTDFERTTRTDQRLHQFTDTKPHLPIPKIAFSKRALEKLVFAGHMVPEAAPTTKRTPPMPVLITPKRASIRVGRLPASLFYILQPKVDTIQELVDKRPQQPFYRNLFPRYG